MEAPSRLSVKVCVYCFLKKAGSLDAEFNCGVLRRVCIRQVTVLQYSAWHGVCVYVEKSVSVRPVI